MKKQLFIALSAMVLLLAGCGGQKTAESPASEDTSQSLSADTGGYYYKSIDSFADTAAFPSSEAGEFDLTKSPKDWVSTAFEKYELTAGVGGNDEKPQVSDLETLLNTEIDYNTNFEICFNNDAETRIVCTNFFTPYSNGRQVTVADCINLGWWTAYNVVTVNGKDYINDTVTVGEFVDVFGKPTGVCMTDAETYQTVSIDSAGDFIAKADEEVAKNTRVEYSLIWTDGEKYMLAAATEYEFGNSVISPRLYGEDHFKYSVLGENVDVSAVDVTAANSSSAAEAADSAGIEQDVFAGNTGDFATVIIKSEYRTNYFTMKLPAKFEFSSMSAYPGYTVEKYVGENLEDDIVYLGTDNDFMASYDGVQNADDTNTERLARKHPDGVWVEANGLKAYAYEDGHIFVSIDNEDSTNLLVSFYGNTGKYSLEKYAEYIMSLVTLVK